MRNPSRAILLAVLMASLILPPDLPLAGAAAVDPASRAPAKSLLLVGDSLSIDLGQQLEAVFAGRPGVRFAHLGKVSSGLANPAFFNWDVQLAAQVKAHHPDVVLIMVGANDNKNLPSGDGHHAVLGTKAWDAAYAARLTRLHTIVRADNPKARIYFLGVPVMADPAFDAETVRINAVLAATAKSLPDTAFVETRDVLADANGGFAAQGKNPDGTMVRLRAKDGVHISPAGSQLLAARCLEAVSGVIGLPRSELLASLEDRNVRPVGKTAGPAPAALAEARPAPATDAKPAALATAKSAVVAAKPVAPAAVVAAGKPAPASIPASDAYTVADGDTLWSVARRLGVSAEQLAAANPGIDPRHLSIGHSLAVPVATSQVADRTPAPSRSAGQQTYAIREGDNLWSVARQYDVTVAALTEANPGLDPARLRIGQTLNVPAAGQAAQVAAARNNPAAYTVADGDNFWSIAHRVGVDVAELKRANAGMDPLKLRPGQVLALPGNARADGSQTPAQPDVRSTRAMSDAGLYPVAKGDTLWSLARRFGVSLDTMLSVNGEIDPSHLQVGQLVTIPGGNQPVASAETLLFPVSAGDTLWGIARRFDLTVEALTAVNPGVDPLRLREGQKLRVPSSLAAVASPVRPEQAPSAPVVSGEVPQLHSVVTGDTLWNLARHYGVSLDRLLELNAGIDPVHLQVGQAVRLPSAVSMAAR